MDKLFQDLYCGDINASANLKKKKVAQECCGEHVQRLRSYENSISKAQVASDLIVI